MKNKKKRFHCSSKVIFSMHAVEVAIVPCLKSNGSGDTGLCALLLQQEGQHWVSAAAARCDSRRGRGGGGARCKVGGRFTLEATCSLSTRLVPFSNLFFTFGYAGLHRNQTGRSAVIGLIPDSCYPITSYVRILVECQLVTGEALKARPTASIPNPKIRQAQ